MTGIDELVSRGPVVLQDPRGHSVTVQVLRRDSRQWHVTADCECGWDWVKFTCDPGRVLLLVSQRQAETFRHQNQAPDYRPSVRDYSANYGPAIEVSQGGHRVKAIPGDHPARPYIAVHRDGTNRGGFSFLTSKDRIVTCSCGAWSVTRNNANGSAHNAEKWMRDHCARSTRPTRDYKWIRARGWVPRSGETEEMEDIEVLRYRRDQIDRELAMLESLPKEPTFDEGAAYVVFFTKRFGAGFEGAREYTYAAVKAGDGLWYTTGPRTPKGYSWDELIRWINSDGDHPVEVYVGIDWELLK